MELGEISQVRRKREEKEKEVAERENQWGYIIKPLLLSNYFSRISNN